MVLRCGSPSKPTQLLSRKWQQSSERPSPWIRSQSKAGIWIQVKIQTTLSKLSTSPGTKQVLHKYWPLFFFFFLQCCISFRYIAPHSSTLAWKILWTEEPGRLQTMGSLRVGHNWATSLSVFTFMHWRRKWQPTPVFLPGESQAWQGLVGCRLWGRTESDTTEAT